MAVSSKIQILVVEDDMEMRKTLKDLLRKMGFKNIVDRNCGAEGINIITENIGTDEAFDLIFLNHNLPDMTGVEFKTKVEGIDGVKAPEYILTLGTPEPAIIKQAISSGLKQIIVKPYSQQNIVEKMINLFDKKKAAS